MTSPRPIGSGVAVAGSLRELLGAVPAESVAAEHELEAVEPKEALQDAVSRMWWGQLGALPVLDGGRLVGCLAEDDVLRAIARRLVERAEDVESQGPDLLVWEDLLGGLTAAEAMTEREDLPVVSQGDPLLAGLARTFRPTRLGARNRYVLVMDGDDRLLRVVSMRDVTRFLIALHDGRCAAPGLSEGASLARASDTMRRVLDTTLGTILDQQTIGHQPVLGSIHDPGEVTITRMWEGHFGYVIATSPAGTPMGICTRRDVMRALRSPFLRLEGLQAARMMSGSLKTLSRLDTLGGLFKSMAIEGCRHMPLIDAGDRVECVVSMWQGVALLVEESGS
ncbi:MAG: CBS domain-containing protein [Myxococcota bacterium]|nr:CBS domain-containing protein [Myxococcota bacterium]